MTFHVGQRVVCVAAEWTPPDPPVHVGFRPKKDSIYVIADVMTKDPEGVFVRLAEAPWSLAFEAVGFRPLEERSTDISIFTALLKQDQRADSLCGND